jgi:LPS-assembly protein
MKSLPAVLATLLACPALAAGVPAENSWRLCREGDSSIKYNPPPVFAPEQKDATRVSAETVENLSSDMAVFSGDVLIERDGLRLETGHMAFNKTLQTLDIDSPMHLDSHNLAIDAERGWMDLELKNARFDNSRYLLPDSHFSGRTPRLTLEAGNETRLVDSIFTSCPPGQEDWYLQTGSLELNQATATGTAKHAVLWFYHVPLFYSPWLQFPLGDERRSGFLMPGFGVSDQRGFEISLPFYWNIAPNMDAMFTPRYMRDRGTQFNTEYRYLFAHSSGEAQVDYLDRDEQTLQERYLLKYRHHTDFTPALNLDLDIQDVSDDGYFNDLNSDIAVTSISHLPRTLTMQYTQAAWRTKFLAQTHETIDPNISVDNRPYRRLPQINFYGDTTTGNSDLTLSLQGEWTAFEHESDLRPTGQRSDIYPRLSWPLQGNAWFITPAAGWRYTQYDLLDASDNDMNLDSRQISVASIDSGLFFERDFTDHYIQTLEPRLFYLNVPYQDQSAIPLFDTGVADFSFAQLFSENRFNGIDRIGDTEQVTAAITTRLINTDTGDELASLSLGQIYYGEDRRVSIDNISIDETVRSDMLAEIDGRYNNWRARSTFLINQNTGDTDRRNVQLVYRRDNRHIANMAYRFNRDTINPDNSLEQTDLAVVWPLSSKYTLLGRWNYSLRENQDVNVMSGIEYESCCWSVRLLAQRNLLDTGNHESSFMLQLVLKGLGSAGDKKTTDILKHAILGYRPDD